MSLKIRRGTDAERLLITPEEGELIYTTDTKELYVGDGETPGGNLTSDNHAGTVTSVTGTGTVAGIALSGTVTTSGNLTLGGTLAVPITNITATGTKDSTTFLRGDGSWAAPVSGSTLPTQTGNSGKVLTTDGTNLSWTTNGNGTVTSVTGTGTVAGISLSGTVNSAGSLTLGGTLAVPVANITATGTSDSTTFLRGDGSWAIPVSGSPLPIQTGNNGKVLTTDGTILSWITPPMGGTLSSNLNTSTYNITNGTNLTINGTNGNIAANTLDAGLLSISSSTITSNDTFTSPNLNTVSKISLPDRTQLQFNCSDGSIGFTKLSGIIYGNECPFEELKLSRGSLITPVTVQTGDTLTNRRIYSYDGTNYILSAVQQYLIDNNASVSTNTVPGKMLFITFPNSTKANAKILSWDSSGRLGVNKQNATETLDVNGTGKFSGYVQFGSYSTTDRNALTAANGMVIYNTSDNKFQGYQNNGWINLDTGTSA